MASRKRSALGKGIGSLIPENQQEPRPVDVFFGAEAGTPAKKGEAATEAEPSATPASTTARNSKKASSSGRARKQSTGKNATPKGVSKKSRTQKKNTPVSTVDEGQLLPVEGITYGEIPLAQIVANSRQPRTIFDEDDLEELAASIKEVGVLQPIVVRPLEEASTENPQARYELIMGERRWRASQLAELEEIPAIVRRTADEDLLRDALLENLHRANLNPIEEAAAYQQLLEDFGCTHEELSRRIARSRPQITNTLRLLKLPPLVQRRLAAGTISAGHARALLSLADAADMEKLAQRIVAEGLSVRAVEELVSLWESPAEEAKPTRTSRAPSPELEALAVRLGDAFDTKVKVAMGARKGSIRIDFAGLDDLNRIVAVLAPGIEGVEGGEPAPSNPAGTSASAGGQAYELGY